MKAKFISDLQKLYDGSITCDDFKYNLTKYPPHLTDLITGSIDHFLDDEKIRAKDPAYKKMQYVELKKLITLLETGASAEQIREINFLTSTTETP